MGLFNFGQLSRKFLIQLLLDVDIASTQSPKPTYLVQNNVCVRNYIVRICTQAALHAWVLLENRGFVFAILTDFTAAPNIISKIVLANYLQYATRPGLFHERFRLQHGQKCFEVWSDVHIRQLRKHRVLG